MVTYKFEPGILLLRPVGEYTFGDVMHELRVALDDPRFQPGAMLLLDVCESEETRTPREIIALADFLGTTQGMLGTRCAVLTCDPHRYGLAMELMGWSVSRGIQVRVFEEGEGDAARAWLLSSRAGADEGGE